MLKNHRYLSDQSYLKLFILTILKTPQIMDALYMAVAYIKIKVIFGARCSKMVQVLHVHSIFSCQKMYFLILQKLRK